MSRRGYTISAETRAAERAQAFRDFADLLDEWIKHEDTERDYWRGERPHRWDMHYWRGEAFRTVRKSLRLRAAAIARAPGDTNEPQAPMADDSIPGPLFPQEEL